MASGYLLDNNHVVAVISRLPRVVAKVASLPHDTQIRVCAITLGEIEAGNMMTRTTNQRRRDAEAYLINERFLPSSLPVTAATRIYYARIMGAIWKRHPPRHGEHTERYLVTEHGVDINDVWAAAVAYEHGLTLVTSDEMKCIKEAIPDLKFECWK